MKKLIIASLALVLASAAWRRRPDTFKRPDCSAFKASLKPESKCFREVQAAGRMRTYEALQKTGLEFTYMARPRSGKDWKAYPRR